MQSAEITEEGIPAGCVTFGLAQIFVCTVEHDICNTISEDIICFFQKFFCQSRIFVHRSLPIPTNWAP